MYNNMEELISSAEAKSVPLWKVILENECEITEKSEDEIFEMLDTRYEVMYRSVHKALDEPQETVGNLVTGMSNKQHIYSQKEDTICGKELNYVMAMALSASEVNAAMGKICASPTAGSCGILPAVLAGVAENII